MQASEWHAQNGLALYRTQQMKEAILELKTAYHHNSIYDYAYLFGADAYILSCGSLSGFVGEDTYQKFLKRFDETPSVILQEHIDDTQPGKSCITVDNYSSFCQCIEHLIIRKF